MMKVYPNYKPSNIQSIGNIPSHWKVCKVKFVSKIFNGNSLNDTEKEDFENVKIEGHPYISTKNIDILTQAITYNGGLKIPFTIQNEYKVADKNSTLLCIEGGSAGRKIAFTNKKVCFGNKLACFKSFVNTDSKFLFYLINSKTFKYQFNLSMTGIIGGVSISSINNFKLPFPNLDEQNKISSFLTRETSRIDNLISEKGNFIRLLQEKRKALISHVVTKGLNDNASMNPSGVDWIGDIPEHWKITTLRYLGKCQNGINIDGDSFGSGHPFISYGDVYKNKALPKKVKGLVQSTLKDRELYSVKTGDVLFTRTSETIEEIGFTSVCHTDMENAVFAGFLIRFRPNKNAINAKYSEYYFQNEKLRAFFVKEMNLVTRASLSQELLKKMPVPIPPLHEQKEISEYISNKTNKTNLLIDEAKSSIDLLKEHRTALISAAVTGKIDVRENT